MVIDKLFCATFIQRVGPRGVDSGHPPPSSSGPPPTRRKRKGTEYDILVRSLWEGELLKWPSVCCCTKQDHWYIRLIVKKLPLQIVVSCEFSCCPMGLGIAVVRQNTPSLLMVNNFVALHRWKLNYSSFSSQADSRLQIFPTKTVDWRLLRQKVARNGCMQEVLCCWAIISNYCWIRCPLTTVCYLGLNKTGKLFGNDQPGWKWWSESSITLIRFQCPDLSDNKRNGN